MVAARRAAASAAPAGRGLRAPRRRAPARPAPRRPPLPPAARQPGPARRPRLSAGVRGCPPEPARGAGAAPRGQRAGGEGEAAPRPEAAAHRRTARLCGSLLLGVVSLPPRSYWQVTQRRSVPQKLRDWPRSAARACRSPTCPCPAAVRGVPARLGRGQCRSGTSDMKGAPGSQRLVVAAPAFSASSKERITSLVCGSHLLGVVLLLHSHWMVT